MCTIELIKVNNTITDNSITNTTMYSGSKISCLLHPLPKITTWEFHYIHPEYSRVVLQRLTTKTSLGFKQAHQEPQLVSKAHQQPQMVSKANHQLQMVSKANQQPQMVSKANQQPLLVSKAHQQPLLVSKAHQQPFLVSRLTKNLIQEIKNKCN